MKWTIDEVNNALWDNDCSCTITRHEDDGNVRLDVTYTDTFGESGEKSCEYLLSSHFVNKTQSEAGALIQIFTSLMVPGLHLMFALEYLRDVDPAKAQHQALFSWLQLLTAARKEVLMAKFGIQEGPEDCFTAIKDWTPPKELFLNGRSYWCSCRINEFHSAEGGKWKCANCGKLHGPFKHPFGHSIRESREAAEAKEKANG